MEILSARDRDETVIWIADQLVPRSADEYYLIKDVIYYLTSAPQFSTADLYAYLQGHRDIQYGLNEATLMQRTYDLLADDWSDNIDPTRLANLHHGISEIHREHAG